MQCFNPRARMGRDGESRSNLFKRVCFNPRARMGRDSNDVLIDGF